ncbi:MAG: TetR family transcriptional regulator [Verrucomicrobiota bacterium]
MSILEAARSLLESEGLSGTSLTGIAREAGLSKANLYRYFENREGILMDLFLTEIDLWSGDWSRRLHLISEPGDPLAIAQSLADSLTSRRLYCLLFASLSSEIEPSLHRETIALGKRHLRQTYIGLIEPLQQAMPNLSKSQANEFLVLSAMFQIGIWSQASPSPTTTALLQEDEFIDMRIDFAERIRWHALILLIGLDSVSQPRTRPMSS